MRRHTPPFRAMRPSVIVAALAVFPLSFTSAHPAMAAPQEPTPQNAPARFQRVGSSRVAGEYIVVLRSDIISAVRPSRTELTRASRTALSLVGEYHGKVLSMLTPLLNGFAAQLSEKEAIALSQDPRVEYVSENSQVQAAGTQSTPPWHLDRVDQKHPVPPNTTVTYNYTADGTGVHIYILDTGIHTSLDEFEGRATQDAVFTADTTTPGDLRGHGTAVASIAAGKICGVAKKARLHSIRVLDAGGHGTIQTVISGLNWVVTHYTGPAVINLSLGWKNDSQQTLIDNAVRNCINNYGITCVVAAMNANEDASVWSPARVDEAITVAMTDRSDRRPDANYPVSPNSYPSNYGAKVDLFAPGYNVIAASKESTPDSDPENTNYDSGYVGTSLAAPAVAGAVAQLLQVLPSLTPAQVAAHIDGHTTRGRVINPGTGSPNKLLHSAVSGRGDTIGVWDPSTGYYHLNYTNDPGPAELFVQYGGGTDIPLAGDWNGDGQTSLGVFWSSNSSWHLTNVLAPPPANITPFIYNAGGSVAGDQPISGDWDGDGTDTPGLFRPATTEFRLNNQHDGSAADFVFSNWGGTGDRAFAGDWDGDGADGVGIFRVVSGQGQFHLRNNLAASAPNPTVAMIPFGQTGDIPLAGDWNTDGKDDIGVYRPSTATFLLRFPDGTVSTVPFGGANWKPVVGNWTGLGQ